VVMDSGLAALRRPGMTGVELRIQLSNSQENTPPPSRGAKCVRVLPEHASSKEEGAGNAGCRPHPWPACNKKAGGSHHRSSRYNRHSLRKGK